MYGLKGELGGYMKGLIMLLALVFVSCAPAQEHFNDATRIAKCMCKQDGEGQLAAIEYSYGSYFTYACHNSTHIYSISLRAGKYFTKDGKECK